MRVGNLSDRLTLFRGDAAVDVEKASGGQFGPDPQAVYDRWTEFVAWARANPSAGEAVPFRTEDLGAPAPRPRQVFAIGANYRDHAEEGGVGVPDHPMVFTKWPSSFTGPVGDVVLPGDTVDWEAELVAVVGRRARDVPASEGWAHVAGLTAGQDLSERTVQTRGEFPQMGLGKSFPGFSPSGPWLVTPDEFADPGDLELGCTVNGHRMQHARTRDLVFPVPVLVAELSRIVTLEPGDVIFTGTPGGVGMARRPPVYLAEGDELVTTIEGIGALRHRFVSA
ncbi:fumarylacetoacetate hydrolase family protein [Actinomadura oligospora]|uniref:fumarylacetoacetate hydrolase family protein n=1 Tax=Actinomadura oligospora TaxID=111804 RepID=UPI00047C04B7|nr:fumarylacetoacetate hydrolase family protein [Actinomadura oligospora]